MERQESYGDPHDLIMKEDVKKALRTHKGPKAKLRNYSIKDFASKGENYLGAITSVIVYYFIDDTLYDTSYIVKMNPCRSSGFTKFSKFLFEKEIYFYTELIPLLDACLAAMNEPSLKLPKCYYYNEKQSKEVIYLEDLRNSGYVLYTKDGMDKQHTEMILQELARLHASSAILVEKENLSTEDVLKRFPGLHEGMLGLHGEGSSVQLDSFYSTTLENTAKVTDMCEGYEEISKTLRSWKVDVLKRYLRELEARHPFRVICHGDAWTNNFLFKYSEDGSLMDCRLIDLQMIRFGSPVLDFSYIFYTSLTAETRRREHSAFLSCYHSNYSRIMRAGGLSVQFSVDELDQEYRDKSFYGLLLGATAIPLFMAAGGMGMEDFVVNEGDISQYEIKFMKLLQTNELLKPRLMDLIDDVFKK